MPHVITETCLGETYARCAAVCPVDAIHPGIHNEQPFMVIDPETCIDCDICLHECPIGAIVGSADDNPAWAKVNAELAPKFKPNPPLEPRPADDQPRKPGHKLVR
ncbi:MAG TPA: ferredoxin [Elusimicrobia bacterium]|nr:ferredoxin [Elusimicrobiota bacterium]HBT61430.1 ferredoxin [Elusimicrobiota bacterium]